MTFHCDRIHSSPCEGHVKKKTCRDVARSCAPIRKHISDAELNHRVPENSSKILRSVSRPNYCEISKRGKKRALDSDSSENMCLELEGGAEEKSSYATNSKCYSGDQISCESIYTGRDMVLTDSVDAFYTKDEGVSNQIITASSKKKKTMNKGTRMSDPKSSPMDDQACNNNTKNDNENSLLGINTCPICHEVFSDNHAYTLHIRKHNDKNKQSHICRICESKLSSNSSLERHMFTHSGERPYKCQFKMCNKAFTTNGNMNRHKRTHSNKKKLSTSGSEKSEDEAVIPKKTIYRTSDDSSSETFRCPVCNQWFISSESLDRHMANHPNDAIECGKCNIVSQNYLGYKKHGCPKLEELKNESSVPKAKNNCVVGFTDLIFMEFSCEKFPLIAKYMCEAEPRSPSNDILAFECHVCSKAFPCNRSLKLHEETHENNGITYCNECRCVISSPNRRHIHQIKHQSMEKSLKIKTHDRLESDKDFFLASLGLLTVTSHPRANDIPLSVKRKPEDCVSQEGLYNGVSIRDTEILNMNSKQNCQTENSNDFADISSIISLASEATLPNIRSSPVTAAPASPENDMVDHDRESPVIEGSANSTFDMSSSENTNSNRESDSHNDTLSKDDRFQCRQCSLSFETMKALRSHARSHSQNGSHCCDFCTYKSVDKSTLLRHMRTHNGERPFKCSLCDYAFTTKANSHRHVKKKHKLPDDQIASAVVYNPNMRDTTSTENIPSDNSGETVCKYCGENFKFPRLLRHHLRAITDSCHRKPFACRDCKLGFSTKNNCIRHINQRHPEYKDNIHKWIVVNQPAPNNLEQQKLDLNLENYEVTTEDDSDNHHTGDQENSVHLNESNSMGMLKEQVNLPISIDEQNLLVHENESTQFKKNMDEENIQTEHPTQTQDSHFAAVLDQQTKEELLKVANCLVFLSEGAPLQIEPEEAPLQIVPEEAPLQIEPDETPLQKNPDQAPLQIEPLDLSVRAIDLSHKCSSSKHYKNVVVNYSKKMMLNSYASISKEQNAPQPAHSSPVMSRIQTSEDQLNHCPLNLVKRDQNKIVPQPPVPVTLTPFIILPQNIITSTPKIVDNHSNNISYPNAICLPINSENTNCQDPCMSQMKMVKKKLVPNDKLHECEYCQKRFTLKSNKERHVKKQHPEYARPARSRNYIPSMPDAGRKCSARTRDAILSRVNARSSTKDNVREMEVSTFPPAIRKQSNSNTSYENIQIAQRKDYFEQNLRNESENNDLASVSSVIDTANSGVINMTDVNGSDLRQWYPSSFGKTVPHIESDSDESMKLSKIASAESSKELACDYCHHTFPWPSSLDRHMRTHTGDKPYSCLGCPLTFSTKSNLDRHLKKKCCHKINYKFQKSFPSPQNDLKGKPQLHNSDELMNITKNSSIKGQCSSHTFDQQQSSSNFNYALPSTSHNPPSFQFSPTTLDTVAHIASLRFQSMESSQSEIECKFCQNTYNTQDDLTNHMKELHFLEYRSLIGETTDQTNETVLPWKNAKRKRDDKFESSIPSAKTFKPAFPCEENGSESGTGNTLIMNLLGMKDSEAIDEMIDSTARIKVEKC